MADYFALLDELRRLWLDLEELKARFLALTDMVVEALFVAVMGYFGGLVAGALTGSALAWTRWDFAVPEPAA